MTFRPKLLLMPMSQFVVLLQLVSVLMFVFCVTTRTHTNNELKYDGSCTAGTNCYLRDDHSH